jgi:hypothetical protein
MVTLRDGKLGEHLLRVPCFMTLRRTEISAAQWQEPSTVWMMEGPDLAKQEIRENG